MDLPVSGSAGLIGSERIGTTILYASDRAMTVNDAAYVGGHVSMTQAADDPDDCFEQVQICDCEAIGAARYAVAEFYVDRSIYAPVGLILRAISASISLHASEPYWQDLDAGRRRAPRFIID